jgi:hypothetical protein
MYRSGFLAEGGPGERHTAGQKKSSFHGALIQKLPDSQCKRKFPFYLSAAHQYTPVCLRLKTILSPHLLIAITESGFSTPFCLFT